MPNDLPLLVTTRGFRGILLAFVLPKKHNRGMVTMLDNKYLSVSEVAALAGCTESYVRWLIRQKKLEHQQIGKKTYVIPIDKARRFAATPRTTGRPRKSDKNC